jgi:hypothetical protein
MDFIDLKTQYRRLKPSIDARLARVLEHGQFIMGPEVAELEALLAKYRRHALLHRGVERDRHPADSDDGARHRRRRRGHHVAVHVHRHG